MPVSLHLALLSALLAAAPAAAQSPPSSPDLALSFYGFDASTASPDNCVVGGCSISNRQNSALTWPGGLPSSGKAMSATGWATSGALALSGAGATVDVTGNGFVWCFSTVGYSAVQCRLDMRRSATGPATVQFVGYSGAATSLADVAALTQVVPDNIASSAVLSLPATAGNQPRSCCAIFAQEGVTQSNAGTLRIDNVWAWGVAGSGSGGGGSGGGGSGPPSVVCPIGQYLLNATSGTCAPCPLGSTTAAANATSAAQCSVLSLIHI